MQSDRSVRAGCSAMSQADMLLWKSTTSGYHRKRSTRVILTGATDAEAAEALDAWSLLVNDADEGEISYSHFVKIADTVLGRDSYRLQEVKSALKVMDLDGNGTINYYEFKSYMLTNASASKDADTAMAAATTMGCKTKGGTVTEDMVMIGNMRVTDLIRTYRRRMMMEELLRSGGAEPSTHAGALGAGDPSASGNKLPQIQGGRRSKSQSSGFDTDGFRSDPNTGGSEGAGGGGIGNKVKRMFRNIFGQQKDVNSEPDSPGSPPQLEQALLSNKSHRRGRNGGDATVHYPAALVSYSNGSELHSWKQESRRDALGMAKAPEAAAAAEEEEEEAPAVAASELGRADLSVHVRVGGPVAGSRATWTYSRPTELRTPLEESTALLSPRSLARPGAAAKDTRPPPPPPAMRTPLEEAMAGILSLRTPPWDDVPSMDGRPPPPPLQLRTPLEESMALLALRSPPGAGASAPNSYGKPAPDDPPSPSPSTPDSPHLLSTSNSQLLPWSQQSRSPHSPRSPLGANSNSRSVTLPLIPSSPSSPKTQDQDLGSLSLILPNSSRRASTTYCGSQGSHAGAGPMSPTSPGHPSRPRREGPSNLAARLNTRSSTTSVLTSEPSHHGSRAF